MVKETDSRKCRPDITIRAAFFVVPERPQQSKRIARIPDRAACYNKNMYFSEEEMACEANRTKTI